MYTPPKEKKVKKSAKNSLPKKKKSGLLGHDPNGIESTDKDTASKKLKKETLENDFLLKKSSGLVDFDDCDSDSEWEDDSDNESCPEVHADKLNPQSQLETRTKVDLCSNQCEAAVCLKVPHFNDKGEASGRFCFTHRLPGMVNVNQKSCEAAGCDTKPYFNEEGESLGRFCSTHRQPGMVNVHKKRCPNDGCLKATAKGQSIVIKKEEKVSRTMHRTTSKTITGNKDKVSKAINSKKRGRQEGINAAVTSAAVDDDDSNTILSERGLKRQKVNTTKGQNITKKLGKGVSEILEVHDEWTDSGEVNTKNILKTRTRRIK